MADIKDVSVIITRETAALTQAGFGMPLILATNADLPYKEYTDLTSVSQDYAETTEAYKMAQAIFSQSPAPEKIAILGVLYDSSTDVPTDLSAALNALVDTHNDWYFLLCEEQGDVEIAELASWASANKKLYFAATSNLSLAGTLTDERAVIMYHTTPTEYPDAAWVGRCAPELPGSITWKFKTLSGITPVDIGVTDLTQLHTNGGNTYIAKLGVNQTSEGLTASGEYIDIIRSQDFIEARMTENVSRLLFTSKKIPYDNTGIAQIVAEVEKTLKLATSQGIIALNDDGSGKYTIKFKRREEIAANDIANRKLTGIEWTAVLAGAIHEVEVRGTLTISEI